MIKGSKHSEETLQKIHKANSGENHPMYGKKHSEKTLRKMSESHKNYKYSEKSKRKMSEVRMGEKNHFYGKKHSEEAKKKISKAKRGKITWMKGKRHSEKSKQKQSESMKGKKPWNEGLTDCYSKKTKELWRQKRTGENNHQWKGGISCEPYCQQWIDKEYKQSIKERDGNKCLNPECNKITNKLCLHHIDYNKKECKPSNLITLCVSCNSKANKNREWHKSWYQAIINKRYKYK